MNHPELFQLKNGLRVVMQRTDFTPVVSLAMWLQVGSADETPNEAGLAHLHEHMIFKGTPRRPVGRIAAEVEGAGGEINAFTSYDQTCYYLTMGKDELELGLDILADAIGNAAFVAKELTKEIKVVLEELKLYRDMPGSHIAERCWDAVFKVHPYGRPIIGRKEILDNLQRKDVMRFYRRHYRPDRMVLSIVGNLDPEQAKAWVGTYFGSLSGKSAVREPRPPEPMQKKCRVVVLNDPINESHLCLGWRAVTWDAPMSAELDLLSMILGSGDSSRLEHRVKTMQRKVYEVTSHVFAAIDPGVFVIDAITGADKASAALTAILREVYRTRVDLVGPQELERAKKNIEAAFIGRHETAAGIGQALGYSVTLTGHMQLEENYLERIQQATREGLRMAANRYLHHANLTAAFLLPHGLKMSRTEIEKTALAVHEEFSWNQIEVVDVPQKKAPVVALLGRFGKRGRLKKAELSNGVKLIVKELAHAPLVAIRTCMFGGLRYESLGQNGISNLTAEMLGRGTKTKSALQFSRLVEDMAGTIRGISGYNSIGVGAEFLSQDFAAGFNLTAEAMLAPAFRTMDVRRAKENVFGHIRQREDNLQSLARKLFSATLYRDHPYGRTILGEANNIRRINKDHIAAFWNGLLDPNNLTLSIVGDVEFEKAFELAEETFGKMPAGTFSPAVFPDPQPPHGIVFEKIFKPKEQAHILLGYLGCRIGSPDEYPLQLINAVLSGQGGRLFVELREKLHLAYSVYSFQREGIERGSFGVYIGTSNQTADQALTALREQIVRVIEKPPHGEEIERAKRYLIGSSQMDLQTNGSLALTMGLNEMLGPGYRAHLHFAERIRKVTDADVARVVRKYLSADDLVVAMIHG